MADDDLREWIDDLRALLQRIETSDEDDRQLGLDVLCATIDDPVAGPVPNPMVDVECCAAWLNALLPGFWYGIGLCYLSGDASLGPDYNDPAHRERLLREWPEEHFHDGLHADLRPGDGLARCCRALIHCALQAIIKRAEMT